MSKPETTAPQKTLDSEGIRLLEALLDLQGVLGVESIGAAALEEKLTALASCIRDLRELGLQEVRLTVQGRTFLLGDHPLQLDVNGYKMAGQLGASWTRLGLGELTFPAGLRPRALITFADQLNGALYDKRQRAALFQRLPAGHVRVAPLPVSGKQSRMEQEPRQMVHLFAELVLMLRQVVGLAVEGKPLPERRLRRLLKELTDNLGRHGGLLLSLCYSPEARKEPETHCVSTMLNTLVVAQRLALSPSQQLDLALAALLHNLPRLGGGEGQAAELARGLAQGSFSDRPAHTGAIFNLLRGGSYTPEALPRCLVLWEGQDHFLSKDLYTGQGAPTPQLSLFSRVISLCCLYDRLIWPWEEDSERPLAQRLATWDQVIAGLDPELSRLFIGVMGLFPIGSIVELSSGEMAVVVAQRKGMPERPMVLIAADGQQGLRVSGPLVDLSQDISRRVIRLADASKLGINPVACFLPGKKD